MTMQSLRDNDHSIALKMAKKICGVKLRFVYVERTVDVHGKRLTIYVCDGHQQARTTDVALRTRVDTMRVEQPICDG